ALFEFVGEFANRVLSLRGCESVAGDKDDLLGVSQLDGRVFRRDLAHGSTSSCSCGFSYDCTESTEQNVGDRAIHRLAHQDGEDESGESIERASDDEYVVAE